LADPIKPIPSMPIERLLSLIETLRGENGCPWDQKQTPDTMARYLIEEVYELVDAIVFPKMRPLFAKKPVMSYSSFFLSSICLSVMDTLV
jgi:hypothetical protein